MARRIEFPHQFAPRDYQRPVWNAFVDREVKRGVCVWHRRAGKDKTFVNIMAAKMAERRGSYFYYFPTGAMGRKVLWEGMDKDGLPFLDHFPADFIRNVNQQEMKFETVTGSLFRIVGTDRLDVVGTNPVGCVFSETSLQNPLGWDYVRPILSENGGWALFNGTPRGKNWFYDLKLMAEANEEWFCQTLTVDDTRAITPEAIEAERRSGMSEEMIRQEYWCDFTAGLPGAIYARLIEQARSDKRIERVPYDGGLPVWTFWDLGAPVNTAVWSVQFVGREIRVLACDTGDDWTTAQRVAMMEGRQWAYAGHILPHDASATQKGGMTYAEELERAGLRNVQVLPRTADIKAGINRLRAMMPSMSFDAVRCKRGIAALEAYHLRFDQKRGMFLDEPEHDWSSHPCDALRYLAEAVACGFVKYGGLVARGLRIISPLEGVGDDWPGRGRRKSVHVISALD